ncbi:unnamed protein product [Hymenolepis diminuta]|uniref:Peptidase A2 domain-containing protein n=1 Tax=Hymenolepis diminuta TaxID=6216 RepID=A0A564Z4B4_HYMDI|nr:unnamed protein product [Hymenolepis diminuta]
MNLSKRDKGAEVCMKNVSESHYEPSVGETFAALYSRNRDVCENGMAGLPNETRINKLFGKFSKPEHDFNLDCHLPPSPKDFTFEERIESARRCSVTKPLPAVSVLRASIWPWIKVKIFTNENTDIVLHHLADDDSNYRSLIAHLNMVENNETRACHIKKPKIDRSPENGSTPQPQMQPQPHRKHTCPINHDNNKRRCRLCAYSQFHKGCTFYAHQRQGCNSCGHKEGMILSEQSITTVNVSRRRNETLCINGLHVDLEFDTGSDSTIVSDEAWKTLGSNKLNTVPFRVSRAAGDEV